MKSLRINRTALGFVFVTLAGLAAVGTAFGQGANATSAAPAESSTAGPAAVVRRASTRFIAALNRHAAQVEKDPRKAEKLVQRYLLPSFDLDFTSRLVLGRYWAKATPEQRKAFAQVFIRNLTAAYAKGIARYRDARVRVLPLKGGTSRRFVSVRSQIHIADHPPIEVVYALHDTPGGWKIFDVKVKGVSFVLTYRNEYQMEIEHTSLAALIKRLQHTQSPKSLTALKATPNG